MKKVCNACKQAKDIDEFSPHPAGSFGRQGSCKLCRAEDARDRYASYEERRRAQQAANTATRCARQEILRRHATEYRELIDEFRERAGLPVSRWSNRVTR